MYYNTNNLTAEPLKEATIKTQKQGELCLEVFKAHRCNLSACQVWKILVKTGKIDRNTPVTSLRRSVTNLKDRGLLEKTDNMVKGLFGTQVHTYKLKA